MLDKVLFLDFDGVLHPSTYSKTVFCHIDLLEESLIDTNCYIVISSSWRFHKNICELKEFFSRKFQDRILGITGEAHIGEFARFHEINKYAQRQGINDWRALDDSYWEFPKNCPQLIRCNPNTGLSASEVKRLQFWLSK